MSPWEFKIGQIVGYKPRGDKWRARVTAIEEEGKPYLAEIPIVDEDGELIAMHFATVIGETVWDWTFRQFHPDAPVPMVTPLDGWEDAMFGVEHYDLDEEPPGLDESLNDIYRRLATR